MQIATVKLITYMQNLQLVLILCIITYDQQVAAVPKGSHWRACRITQRLQLMLYPSLGLYKMQYI